MRGEATGAVARGRSDRPAPQTRRPASESKGKGAKGAGVRSKGAPPKETPAKERRGRPPRSAGAGTGAAAAKSELAAVLGASRGAKANERLREAAHAFERERYDEARLLLKPLAEAAPQATTVRELLGLTYYRLGRWKEAVHELEAFRQQARTTEQHPVLADAYRGLQRHDEVEELWEELREASPSADLVTEGRIVMAGSLADRGRFFDAIELLGRRHRGVTRPRMHHVRQAYALGDLYERAGDVARARELFRWVVEHEPEFADAAQRAAALT